MATCTSRASVDVPLDSALLPDAVPAGMAWVVDAGIASGDGASLLGVELGSGDRQKTDLTRDPRRVSDLAGPAVLEGRAYMVDRDASEVIEVNTDTGRVVHRERLDIDDTSRVEVRGQGDTVFVNDLSSEYAIVIRDGEYTTLDKYTNEGVAVTTPPDDATPPAPAPARTSAPSSRNAPPAPAPSGPPRSAQSTGPPAAAAPATTAAPPPEEPAPRAELAPPGPPLGRECPTRQPQCHRCLGGAGQRRRADAYELRWEGGELEVPASQTRATVDGLRNGREYVVSVTAVNAAGESAQRGRTPSCPPVMCPPSSKELAPKPATSRQRSRGIGCPTTTSSTT